MKARTIAVAALALILTASLAHAGTVVLDAVDTGWYSDSRPHVPLNQGYLTYASSSPGFEEYRSFFVFDLSSVTDPILSAALRAYNPGASVPGDFSDGFGSSAATATINLYDVATDLGSLTDGTAGSAGFDDLGTGTVLGSYVASDSDNGTLVSIPLNAAAVASLNTATGLFALGGAMEAPPGGGFGLLFLSTGGPAGGSVVSDTTRQLVLQTGAITVPLPATGGLGLLGLLLMAGVSRWSRRRGR